MSVNQAAALKVGQLARDMARGYAAHTTAIRVASRLDAKMCVRLIADYRVTLSTVRTEPRGRSTRRTL